MAEDWVIITDEMLQETEADVKLAESSRGFYRVGKLTTGMGKFKKWVNKQPVDIDYSAFVKLSPKERSFEYAFDVDIKEFDERARAEGWSYTRNVNPRSANWTQILEPSLEAILGKGCLNADHRTKTIQELQGRYVAILDVPQAPGKDGQIPANKETGRPYTTVKFAKIFANRDEAKAFYDDLRKDQAPAEAHTSPVGPSVPQVWASNPDMLFQMLKSQYAGSDPVAAAKSTMLISKNGEVAQDETGKKIDLCAIFARAYDVSPEFYADAFKAFV